MPGRHNVSNATAAIAVAHELGMSAEAIKKGLSSFGGVKRRFTHDRFVERRRDVRRLRPPSGRDQGGAEGGARAPPRAASSPSPSRTASPVCSLFEEFAACFNDADTVMVAPVYAAGEEPIEGRDSEALVSRIRAGGHRDARYIEGPAERSRPSSRLQSPAISWFFLGAGNITQWAYALPNWKLSGPSHETGEWGKASCVDWATACRPARPPDAGCAEMDKSPGSVPVAWRS
jgi:UDP-N-acetylmuramate--alanine ligase